MTKQFYSSVFIQKKWKISLHRDWHKNFIGASFRIAPNRKQQVSGQAKPRYIYTTEYVPATQKKDLLIHEMTWMSLKKHCGECKSQTRKSTSWALLFIRSSRSGNSNLRWWKLEQGLSGMAWGEGLQRNIRELLEMVETFFTPSWLNEACIC